MKRLFLSACFASVCALAQTPADPWKPLRFLIGEWTGEGGGGPGQGSGAFSLGFELNGKVLIRRNLSEYPAQGGRPAERHEDLMIVYLDEASSAARAIFFDSEGHVIRYRVAAAGAGVVFESEPGPGPGYRLSYVPAGAQVKGKFEIRAPGEDRYRTYLDFTVRRK